MIASDGTPQWFFADLAAQSLGGVTVGIYPTNPWPELQYIVRHCKARFAVCGDQEQTDKVLDAQRHGDGVPYMMLVLTVDIKGMRRYAQPMLRSWDDALAEGRVLAQDAARCCCSSPGAPRAAPYRRLPCPTSTCRTPPPRAVSPSRRPARRGWPPA